MSCHSDINIGVIDTIRTALTGHSHQNALDFVTFLSANGIIAGGEHDEVRFGGACVCYIHLSGEVDKPGPWSVWPEGDYSDDGGHPISEKVKSIARAHVNHCTNCGGGCNPGSSKMIFGEDFNDVCSSVMAFCDPDDESLECLKQLILMRVRLLDGDKPL